jgi:hypothetical protein
MNAYQARQIIDELRNIAESLAVLAEASKLSGTRVDTVITDGITQEDVEATRAEIESAYENGQIIQMWMCEEDRWVAVQIFEAPLPYRRFNWEHVRYRLLPPKT